MACVDENLRCEGAMETVRDVVLQLDASQRPLVHLLSVQHHKLCAVCLWDIELYQHKAVILLPLRAALPAQPRHKDRLTDNPVGIPHLPLLVLGVMLEGGGNTDITAQSEKPA